MNTQVRKFSVLAAVVAMLATIGLVSAPAEASAPSLLSRGQVKKILLTLPQIRAVSGVRDVAADDLTCHHAPYYSGFVNYCYYVTMHSDASYKAGKGWPNHVDVIAFDSAAEASRYIRETKRDRTTSKVLRSTPTSVTFYDTDAPVTIPGAGTGPASQSTGPTVSVFAAKGAAAVYTACTNPKATDGALLAVCAEKLAAAQLARLK